ncbi:Ni,Fe-hydrogenase I large subunit [Hydrogenivirga caldilitoris]|uniref:Ni,Fe-hydrogenase I large subunit n=1 Tax=Hydrogenivirga caldilitoris TaxID=246264 RepID=A0A497XNL8_9AQUI|nr:nickel-dependent hydrogenase large subunit [Hydrogenivirga caldilitoris]RLJ70556.1 Ni,Fe-hydrogenase I large subunit [Hydrogenivirga caldilitoris]
MKIQRKLLNRIEGEVELKLLWDSGRIKDAFVCAPNYRGFEKLLVGRPYLDAVVITPRICGICGHAHLMASVEAIEDAYRKAGFKVELSDKAQRIRKLTLTCEFLQNHLRWFYLYLMPDIIKLEPNLRELYEPLKGSVWTEALKASNLPVKVIALFGGQWPHTSYAVPGGVVCDPTGWELVQAEFLLRKLKEFFEERLLGMTFENYLSLKGEEYLEKLGGDMRVFCEVAIDHGLHEAGASYDRFLSGGNFLPGVTSGVLSENGKKFSFEVSKVSENEDFSFFSKRKEAYTWSKAARYEGLPYETGPLARQLMSGNEIIKNLYGKYGSSVLVRVLARLDEGAKLLKEALVLLSGIKLNEPSWIKPPLETKNFSGKGVGVIEASRGTLIHEIEINQGKIKSYNVITPTVWNLGPRDGKYLGVVERAVVGMASELKAEIVVRSFDVCSVCTSH